MTRKFIFITLFFGFLLCICCDEAVAPIVECSKGEELPDLEIIDIFISPDEPDHFKVTFINRGRTPSEETDFLILFSCENGNYTGNPSYRYLIPEPNTTGTTNSLPFSVIGMVASDTSMIHATIDWEERIDEQDECNNSYRVNLN